MEFPENDEVTNYNQKRLVERGIDELIGICRGILFDGIACYSEAVNLLTWLENNRLVASEWPANKLFMALRVMLADHSFSSEDESQFLELLMNITGSPSVMNEGRNPSTMLPLCDPQPEILFEQRVFVLTGNFQMGPRKSVIQMIERLGGEVVLKNIRLDTNYLVIGNIGSTAWMHSTHGRKIERALELKNEGRDIFLISEKHFMNELKRNSGVY